MCAEKAARLSSASVAATVGCLVSVVRSSCAVVDGRLAVVSVVVGFEASIETRSSNFFSSRVVSAPIEDFAILPARTLLGFNRRLLVDGWQDLSSR